MQKKILLRKIENLMIKSGFRKLRRCRRDGNCFYRSYLFGLFWEMSLDLEFRKLIIKKFQDSLLYCAQAGYDKFILEEMSEEVLEVIKETFLDMNDGKTKETDEEREKIQGRIEKLFENGDLNYPICYLRCITGGYMKTNVNDFEPFLVTHQSVAEFCLTDVDPLYKEADQLQITALSGYFKVPLIIYYLDNNSSNNNSNTNNSNTNNADTSTNSETSETCNVIEFFLDQNKNRINLIYRPGHYELLYP